MTLRLLDTFSGIGGFSYAAEKIVGGYETVAFVEREPYCQKILRKHWPNVPIYDDITTFTPPRGSADVICGGFPCQDISTAGKQAGIKEGTRSGLFYELMRVIRLVQPQFVILENVAAILNNGLDTVLGELATAGFDAEWACIPASAVGACHQRDRWWLVAYPQSHQRHDGGSAHSAEPARAAAQLGNGDGANAAHTHDIRPSRSKLPLPSLCGSHQGGKAQLGNRQTPWSQRWANGSAGHQSVSPYWQSYVSQPVLCRGDDGLSRRVDRLKALGNAVVPQVAAIPLKRVLDLATPQAGDDGPKLLKQMLELRIA